MAAPEDTMTTTLARPIKFPGAQISAGEPSLPEAALDGEELAGFESELGEIALAEREAAADSDLIHLA
jgi:hypothetical protein